MLTIVIDNEMLYEGPCCGTGSFRVERPGLVFLTATLQHDGVDVASTFAEVHGRFPNPSTGCASAPAFTHFRAFKPYSAEKGRSTPGR